MAFIEDRFPIDIAYGSVGGPQYNTDVIMTQSGWEQRNANWSQARATYNVTHGVKAQAQLDALIAFFRARRGRADGFRFKDWTDYRAAGQIIATANGTQSSFQLVKTYTSGGVTTTRIVKKPVPGTQLVYINAVLTSAYTLDTTTGMLTLTTPPAAGAVITADFEFDVPVRFDTDQLAASLDAYSLRSWHDITLVEIRL